MSLVTLKEILAGTRENQYAVGAFNFSCPEDAEGIIMAGVEKNAPVILMVSMNALKYNGLKATVGMIKGMAEAVDILGGVEVEITNEEAGHLNNYCVETSKVTGKSYSSLPGAGTYNLNGVQAVSFGRIRYTAGDDFKRTERQRLVVEKMVEKALASDVGTINELIDSVFPKIKTSLSKSEILSLAKDAFNYKMGENAGFPFDIENEVVSISYQKGSQDCVIPADLAANVKQLHDFLYGTTSYQVTDSVQSISDEIVYRTGVRAQKD